MDLGILVRSGRAIAVSLGDVASRETLLALADALEAVAADRDRLIQSWPTAFWGRDGSGREEWTIHDQRGVYTTREEAVRAAIR